MKCALDREVLSGIFQFVGFALSQDLFSPVELFPPPVSWSFVVLVPGKPSCRNQTVPAGEKKKERKAIVGCRLLDRTYVSECPPPLGIQISHPFFYLCASLCL